MKLLIEIPEEIFEALRKAAAIISGQRSGKSLTSIIFDAVAKGTPLEQYELRQKMFSYLDGVADGLNEASRDTIDALNKIRSEIEQIADEEQKHDEKWALGLRYAIKIIDKYRNEARE